MSQLLLEKRPSLKPIIKYTRPGYSNATKAELEFRWSELSEVKNSITEETPIISLEPIDLNSSKKKITFAPSVTVRNLGKIQSPTATSKSSPRAPIHLPNIHNTHKIKSSSVSPEEVNNTKNDPIIVTYSELHRAHQNLQAKKTTETKSSAYPALNDKKNRVPNVNNRAPSSSKAHLLLKYRKQLLINKYKK